MKFNVQSKLLLSQLQAVSKVINTKNAMSILDNFLFEVKGERLYITGSDQENVMTASLDITDVEGEGSVALGARRLLDMLKELPAQGVTIDVNEENLETDVRFLSGHFLFMGVNADEFPRDTHASDNAQTLRIPAQVVQKGIENTIFAVSTDTLRPVMMGIYWDIHNEDITFVSSDTHKLVRYINREIKPGLERAFIMPAKPAGILRGIISKEDTEVNVTVGEKHATFTVGDYELVCRFINGNYPNYNRVIPQDNPFTLKADRETLLNAMRRMGLFASSGSMLVKLDIKADHIHLSAQDADYGLNAEENVPCEYQGNDMVIGFKAPYMIEVLNSLKSDEVLLRLSDPARPGIFVPGEEKEDEDILVLLMPMQTFDY